MNPGSAGRIRHIDGSILSTNLKVVRRACSIFDRLLPSSPHSPHGSRWFCPGPVWGGHFGRYAEDTTKM